MCEFDSVVLAVRAHVSVTSDLERVRAGHVRHRRDERVDLLAA